MLRPVLKALRLLLPVLRAVLACDGAARDVPGADSDAKTGAVAAARAALDRLLRPVPATRGVLRAMVPSKTPALRVLTVMFASSLLALSTIE